MVMVDLLWTILKAIWNALARITRVASTEPKRSHTVTEYVDAALFPDDKPQS